jgi:hypothetical protein
MAAIRGWSTVGNWSEVDQRIQNDFRHEEEVQEIYCRTQSLQLVTMYYILENYKEHRLCQLA